MLVVKLMMELQSCHQVYITPLALYTHIVFKPPQSNSCICKVNCMGTSDKGTPYSSNSN